MRGAWSAVMVGAATSNCRPGTTSVPVHVSQQAVFVELRLDQAEREPGRPDLFDAGLAQQIREAPDVVLVGVRQQHGPDRPVTFTEIGQVGEDQIDAEMLVSRERDPGIDDHGFAADLVDHHVLPDLAEAAQGHDAAAVRHPAQSKRDACGDR